MWLWLFSTVIWYWVWTNLSTQNDWDIITKDIWNNLVNTVNNIWSKVETGYSIPKWAVIAFNLSSCPDGWLEANGNNWTLDLRWEFIRWLDNWRWVDNSRTLWSHQSDTIRNITWEIKWVAWMWNNAYDWWFQPWINGVFSVSQWNSTYNKYWWAYSAPSWNVVKFDASTVVPTSNENRPRNVALLYCIKN